MVKVFVSYSRESVEHTAKVQALVDRLRKEEGIRVDFDGDVPPSGPREGWSCWSLQQMDQADRVLIVGSREYAVRFEGEYDDATDIQALRISTMPYRRFRARVKVVLFDESDEKYVSPRTPTNGDNDYFLLDQPQGYRECVDWLRGAELSSEEAVGIARAADAAGVKVTEEPPRIDAQVTVRTPRVFLCYRRDDTQDAVGRLHDRLTATYGFDRVFMDIDSVPLGIDFVDHVTEQISRCSVVIVMIGRQWLTITDKQQRRRLDDPDDLLRAEIRSALRQKIPVIPVVVQGASMPVAEDLPDDIRLLARRNGIELRSDQWTNGVERLFRELDPVIGGENATRRAEPELGDRRRLRFTVHRAVFLSDGREAYFLNATNLSKDRDIVITHVWLDSTPPIPAAQPDRPLPKRLKPDETWETWIYVDQVPPHLRDSVVELAKTRLSTGKQVNAKANVGVPPIGLVPGP